MKQIITRKGEINALADVFGCCRKTVGEALMFKTDTDLARRIRRMAIERGGRETDYKS